MPTAPTSSVIDRTPPSLLRPADVAELLRCSTRQVRTFAERGELPKIRLGRRSGSAELAALRAAVAGAVPELPRVLSEAEQRERDELAANQRGHRAMARGGIAVSTR